MTWVLHGSEAFICKASKGEGVVCYFEPLVTQHMKASGSPSGWNLMRKKPTILLTYRVIILKFIIFLNHCVIKVYKILIKFHTRFRYQKMFNSQRKMIWATARQRMNACLILLMVLLYRCASRQTTPLFPTTALWDTPDGKSSRSPVFNRIRSPVSGKPNVIDPFTT